jgi:hypothetical protein
MNSNHLVPKFVLGSVLIYLVISLLAFITGSNWQVFKRVNLIADIVKQDSAKSSVAETDSAATAAPVAVEKKASKDFGLYTKANLITNFNSDTNQPSLIRFLEKLHDLKTGKKRKIRVGYFGDSMIEGDLLTQTLRKLLQKEFGGWGVGFVPITSQVSKLRQTVTTNYSGGWKDDNFKTDADKKNLFLSGHIFRGHDDWVEMKDQTIPDSSGSIEKALLFGYAGEAVPVKINNAAVVLKADKRFNRMVLNNNASRSIRLAVENENLPVYGISFESSSGIIVDNFSFRGISGIEFSKIDSSFLAEIAAGNAYDLLIFQYGVNVLFRPNEKNFNWYARMIIPVINKIKNCFSDADMLIVSTADRAFRYDDEYKSAIGIDSLIRIQATAAYQANCSFYNQFSTMGGHNSIVDWASRTPSLANKDYVHPNFRGADTLANFFYHAIMKDYQKYIHTLK